MKMMKVFIARTAVLLLTFLLGMTPFSPGQPAVFAAAGPDLTVQEINLSPSEPALGERVTITVAVKNLGDTRAGNSLITCYIDDTVLDTKPIDAIEPGITATVSFTWIAAGGSHIIKAIADAGGVIPESNEGNNTGTYSLTTSAPDLIVQSITWQPQQPSRGDNIVITVTIKNQGNVTSRYSNMNLYIDEGSRGSQDFNTIEPGGTIKKTYNWVVLDGSHTFKAVVDENNNNVESNETNNRLTAEFGTLPADLTVDSITWLPLSPSKDDVVTFTATVTNIGSGKADLSYLGYYIDDVFLGMIPTPVLNPGTSTNVTFTWKTSLNAHSVTAAADYYKMVKEINEDNNTLTASLLALPPDLVVSNVTWTPLNPCAGDQVTFTVYVKNQGGGRADPSELSLNIGSKPPILLDFPAIAAGAETSVSTKVTAESGSYKIQCNIDYLLRITESNKNNNSYSTSFYVEPPDLLITSITYSPDKPALNDTITISITVKNQGKGKATAFDVCYFIDDVSTALDIVNPLDAGASKDITWQWKVQNGRHVFKAIIDYNNALLEANENNNTATISIAPNMPDLSITNVTWSPAEMPAGEDIIFTIDIENLGGLTAQPSRLVYYVDDIIAGFNDIGAIPAGEKTTQKFTWAASVGHHNITIVADSKDQIKEIDETNNTVIVSIPPPDLQVQSITYSPQNALSGDITVITASIINARGTKTQESMAECYVDGSSIGAKRLAPLETGETGKVSFQWMTEPGSHTFKIVADRYKTVMETDETNNEAEITFTATAPDLVIDNIRWSTDSRSNSKEVNLMITVKNTGACTSGKFSVQCAFDNSPPTVREIQPIIAGGTAEFTVTPILSEGTHTVKIILDTNNEISEINKENNKATYSFSTIAPDLIIRSITWSPMTANTGDNITITAKVENIGLGKATDAIIALTIDGTQTGTINIAKIDGGATALADFSWKAREGEHIIELTADTAQTITESNETNNTRSRTITFAKPETPAKKTPIVTLNATTGGGLLETWWWIFLVAGVALGLGILYSTIRNMRKK